MGQTEFADSFIKAMLGWIRWIASSIANMFQSGSGRPSGGAALLSWFTNNWITVLVALILIGIVTDWIVWMARWRPYWVWFRKRRILLDSDIDDIDDDDLMLRYGHMAADRPQRARYDEDEYEDDEYARQYDDGYGEYDDEYGDEYDDEYDDEYGDEYDDEHGDEYDDEYGDEYDDEYDGGHDGYEDVKDYAHPAPQYPAARRGAGEDLSDFDALYDDVHGDYGPEEDARAQPPEPDQFNDEDEWEEPPLPRARPRSKGLFSRLRKTRAEESGPEDDPFSIEGDFFDDLGDDPMDDLPPPAVRVDMQPDVQDTSAYRRPTLLPGDEPGAVREVAGSGGDEGSPSPRSRRQPAETANEYDDADDDIPSRRSRRRAKRMHI